MDKHHWLTIGCVVAILAVGLFTRYGPYGGTITHDFPVTVNAGDPNSRLSEAEHILETGSVKFMPRWFTGENDLLMTQPPLNLVLAAMMAGAAGIAVFDAFYFNAVMAGIGAALVFFVFFFRVF